MQLKSDPSLEYQQDAINAVVNAFEGHPPRFEDLSKKVETFY